MKIVAIIPIKKDSQRVRKKILEKLMVLHYIKLL